MVVPKVIRASFVHRSAEAAVAGRPVLDVAAVDAGPSGDDVNHDWPKRTLVQGLPIVVPAFARRGVCILAPRHALRRFAPGAISRADHNRNLHLRAPSRGCDVAQRTPEIIAALPRGVGCRWSFSISGAGKPAMKFQRPMARPVAVH
jgi:hypothetical protein